MYMCMCVRTHVTHAWHIQKDQRPSFKSRFSLVIGSGEQTQLSVTLSEHLLLSMALAP